MKEPTLKKFVDERMGITYILFYRKYWKNVNEQKLHLIFL
jgi:hypothetical protein